MNSILLECGERQSMRMNLLVSALRRKLHPSGEPPEGFRDLCFLHFIIWKTRWGGDAALDHGVFFEVSEKQMGLWAEHDAPLEFGRALVAAGYVKPIAQVYPPEIVGERGGFVAMMSDGRSALDASWEGWHGRRETAAMWVPFLTNRARRLQAASALGGTMFDGTAWMRPPDVPHDAAHHAGHGGGQDVGRGAVRPPSSPSSDREKTNSSQRREEFEKPTSGKPTREFVLEFMYADPLKVLRAFDSSEAAMWMWSAAVKKNSEFVRLVLAEMVESEEKWRQITHPAKLANSRLDGKLRLSKKARGSGERGGSSLPPHRGGSEGEDGGRTAPPQGGG